MYKLCKRLIAIGRTEGLLEKVNTFYAFNQLTEAEYKELMELLSPAPAPENTEAQ